MDPLQRAVLSPEGAVVIPESIRDRLGLEAGTPFTVVGEGDLVILAAAGRSGKRDVEKLLAEARRSAEAAGLRLQGVKEAVRAVRREPRPRG